MCSCNKMEISPLEDFFNPNVLPLYDQSTHFSLNHEFPDLEHFGCGFSSTEYNFPLLSEDIVLDEKPFSIVMGSFNECDTLASELNSIPSMLIEHGCVSSSERLQEKKKKNERKVRQPNGDGKTCSKLGFKEIKKHFDVPITEAAKEMNVGITSLKRRCRELNIMRWPYRKLQSLNSLINNVQELGWTEEWLILEEQKRLIENFPDMELSEQTKKLRHACYSAQHKMRSLLAIQH